MDKVLLDVANRLGVTAAHLWPQLVMVTFVESLFSLLADPILFAFATVATVRLGREFRRFIDAPPREPKDLYDYVHDDRSGYWVGLGIAWLAYLIIVVCIVATLPGQIAGVFNPEGETVYRLLRSVTSK